MSHPKTGIVFLVLLWVLFPMSAFPAAEASAPVVPDTAMGKLLGAFVDTVNSGDTNRIATFVTDHFVLTNRAVDSWPTSCCVESELRAALENISKRSGGIELETIYPRDMGITAFARCKKSGPKIFLSLESTAATPNRISNYQFVATPPDIDDYLPKISSATSLAARLDLVSKAFGKAAKRDLFSGTVLIAHHGDVVFSGAYGEANRANQTSNTMTTRFGIASTGKLFTGVAVAQLVSQGKLDYDAPIIRYLPDYPNPAVAAKITLRELLTHTSGLGDIFAKEAPLTPLNRLTDYYPLFANDPLLFEPGKGQAYSNTGFLLASIIVEQVSGEEFKHYLRTHIFEPAGMHNTDWGNSPSVARPYMRNNSDDPLAPDSPWITAEPFYNSLLGGPAAGHGGEYSTAEDLYKFAVALGRGSLLEADAFSVLIRDGLACQSYDKPGHRIFAHTGGGPGVNSGLKFYVDQGYVIVFLSNYSPPFPQLFADRVGDFLINP
jgi:D-alanyl-D-alanine carboxypeptidase